VRAVVRDVLEGYDRRSAVTLVSLALGYLAIAVIFRRYLDLSRGMDWLLFFVWGWMSALLCWGLSPARDLARAAVGLGGGLFIESWGTVTSLWWYFTAERPPVWILPAWPVAAIAIDRMSRMLDRAVPDWDLRFVWWSTLPAFVVTMTHFVWPYVDEPLTKVAIVAMLGVLVAPGGTIRQDVTLMLAGSSLGWFLEYWGTSRHCWNYYTHEIPPFPAVLAHGFAAVAFQRVIDTTTWAWRSAASVGAERLSG
jgi:hypothetical protein